MDPRWPRQYASAEDVFYREEPPLLWWQLPPDLRDRLDPSDPQIDFIIDELASMRAAGFDMTAERTVLIAVDTARVKAAAFSVSPPPFREPERITLPGYCAPPAVVYYARLGNRCKIGWTSDLVTRMKSIRPEELLATEPGGQVTETERHHQFAALRVVGEWFRYEGSLVEHVERLRSV
jgi:hypothetical protein